MDFLNYIYIHMHLNKTKFERNLSLGFDVCNIKKAGGATCTL